MNETDRDNKRAKNRENKKLVKLVTAATKKIKKGRTSTKRVEYIL